MSAGTSQRPARVSRRKYHGATSRTRALAHCTRELLWTPDARPVTPVAGGSRRQRVARLLPVLVSYAFVTVVMTFPLVLRFTNGIPGDAFDAYLNLWSYWWVGRALLALQNPFWTPLLYAPFGAPLYLNTLTPINGLLTLPVQLLAGSIVAYNMVVTLSLTLAASGAYLLVTHLTGSRVAGWFGGLIFGFGSYHMMHLLGHANLLASEGLPVYLLLPIVTNDARGRRRTFAVTGAVVALLFIMLSDWQYVVFAILATLLYTGCQILARRSVATLVVATTIGALWFVLALRLIVPTWREMRSGIAAAPSAGAGFAWSADLISFFVPSPLQSLWGAQAERIGGRVGPPANERSVFLGYVPLTLATIGLALRRRAAAFWLVLALVAGLLALGPAPQVLGKTTFGPAQESITLPYALPGLNILRVPARFAILVILALAVLSGFGIAELVKRHGVSWSRPARGGACMALTVLLLLEHIAVPFPMTTPRVPRFYTELAKAPEPGVIYELPFSLKRPASLYSQTIHQRPIVAGYVSRRLNNPLRLFPRCAGPTDGDITPPVADVTAVEAWVLRASDVRWLVELRQDPQLNVAQTADFLSRYALPDPLYVDEETAVYRPRPPGPPLSAVRVGYGWFPVELVGPDRTPVRWMSTTATFYVWTLADSAQSQRLRFNATTFNAPRRLRVALDGANLGVWRVEATQRLDTPVTLEPGLHTVTLTTIEPPISPWSVNYGDDGRPLSFAIVNVDLQRSAHCRFRAPVTPRSALGPGKTS